MKKMATEKQKRLLSRYGIRSDLLEKMSHSEASALVNEAARNNWAKPRRWIVEEMIEPFRPRKSTGDL